MGQLLKMTPCYECRPCDFRATRKKYRQNRKIPLLPKMLCHTAANNAGDGLPPKTLVSFISLDAGDDNARMRQVNKTFLLERDDMILDPNFHELQGYEDGINGRGFHSPAGTNDACVVAYQKGYDDAMYEMTHDPRDDYDPGEYLYDSADGDSEAPYEDDYLYDDPADLYPEW